MKQYLVCAVLGIGCFDYSTFAQTHPGSVDPSFQPQFELSKFSRIRDIIHDGNGRFIVASDNEIRRLLEDGSIDPAFHSISSDDGAIKAMDSSPEGKIYLGGNFTQINDFPYPGVARLLENGDLDYTFQPEPAETVVDVIDVALQSTGHLLVGGNIDVWGGQAVPNIVRLNPDGSMDADFNKTITDAFENGRNTITNIEVLSGDRFRIDLIKNIVEFHSNGEIAREFEEKLVSIGPPLRRWTTTRDEGLLVCLSSIRPGTEDATFGSFHLFRLNADGSADPSLDVKMSCDGFITQLAVQADGRILLGGGFSRINNQRHHQLVRLQPDGSIDTSFVSAIEFSDNDRHASGYVYLDHTETLPDGDILLAGSFSKAGGMEFPGLARLNGGAGEPGAPWIGEGVSTSWTVEEGAHLFFSYQVYSPGDYSAQWSHNGVALDDGEGPVLQLNNVGFEHEGTYQLRVSNEWGEASGPEISLDVNPAPTQPGSIDYTFQDAEALKMEDGLWKNINPRNVVLSGGYLYVSGWFTHYGGHPTPWVARLFSDGRVDRSFVCLRDYTLPMDFNRAELATVLHDQKALLNSSYRRDDSFIDPPDQLLLLNPDGSLDRIFDAQGSVTSAVETSEGKIVLGGVLRLEGVEPFARVARLNRDGTLDPSFGVFTSPNLNTVKLEFMPDGRLLALFKDGQFLTTGIPRYELRLFHPDGTEDAGFQVDAELPSGGEQMQMALDPQGRIYLASGPHADAPGSQVIRISPDGSLDSEFNSQVPSNRGIDALAVAEDGTIVAHFRPIASVSDFVDAVRLQPDGIMDHSFQFDLKAGSYPAIRKLLIDENGQLIFAGDIYDRRTGRIGVIRLNGYDERRLHQARLTEEGFEAALRTRSGHRYSVESTSDLSSGAWQETANQIGDGAPHNLVFPVSGDRFFRVRLKR